MTRHQRLLFILRWVPALCWAGIIFRLSHMSEPPDAPPFLPINDKVAHMGLYAILSGLTYWGARGEYRPRTAAWIAFLFASIYGITDEWHQSYVPNRTPDIYDWYADVAGAAWVLLHARVCPHLPAWLFQEKGSAS